MHKFINDMRTMLKPKKDSIILDWLYFIGDLSEGTESDIKEELDKVRRCLYYVKNNYSAKTLQKSLRFYTLPNEIINAAEYFEQGYSSKKVYELGKEGYLQNGPIPSEFYGKSELKDEEETLETLIAEDLVEQTAYALNTPKGVTESEQAKNMLGMIGANIMDESIYEEPDYEKEVEESIVKEFADFKRERTAGKTVGEVFDDAYEIHVKTQLKNAVGEEYFTPEIYKALYQKKGGILQALYDAYQQDSHASVTTNTDAQEFVEKYCDQNFPKIMNGDELAPTMGG